MNNFTFPFEKLKSWFLDEARELPWRENLKPYSIWVSEVMLQQTRASVVIPYFERWMERFPTVQALAQAHLDEVIKLWEGLGYYSRARSLHEGAKYIVENFEGQVPDTAEELNKIKGLGPYTIGAILSFAFHKKAAAVDGNVIRVLSRFLDYHEDVSKAKNVDYLRQKALELLPENESWIQNEALIELGATICSKIPKCLSCPLKSQCLGFARNTAQNLPIKTLKTKTEFLYRNVAILKCEDHYLVQKGTSGKIMSDLHEFPYFETIKEGISTEKIVETIYGQLSLKASFLKELSLVKHSFTKYQVTLFPKLFICKKKIDCYGYKWMTLGEMQNAAFSSGHKRVLAQINC